MSFERLALRYSPAIVRKRYMTPHRGDGGTTSLPFNVNFDAGERSLAIAKKGALSRRETEVLRLVAEGLNNQSIAQRLFVSDHTVHRHLANILNKLDVSTRAAAVAQATRRGLLS